MFWVVEVYVDAHLSDHVFCIFPAWPFGIYEEAILGTEEFCMVGDELGGDVLEFSVVVFIPI